MGRGTGVRILSAEVRRSCPRTVQGPPWISVRRPLAISLVLLAGLCVAPSAFGSSSAHATTVDLRIGEQRVATTGAVPRFTLAGVSWRGSGRVELRTRSTGGRWSAWRPAAPEAEDGPDAGSPEQRRARLAPRESVLGRGRRIASRHAWPGTSRECERSSSGAPRSASRSASRPRPERRRSCRALSWGADESIRRGPPTYAPAVRFAIVHHTAGRNDYSRAEAAAIVKGIQLFHVQGNGWNDIGYNFLVDRFGTIYEGRFGGIDRNVVGAHALGFNTGSVGIALLGTYGDAKPSAAAQDAIARLIAWRLDLAHVDPDLVPHVHLGWKRAVRERHPRAAERRLGSPRHGLHRVSGECALLEARRDRGLGPCPRRTEDLRAPRRRSRAPRSAFARSSRSHSRGASR